MKFPLLTREYNFGRTQRETVNIVHIRYASKVIGGEAELRNSTIVRNIFKKIPFPSLTPYQESRAFLANDIKLLPDWVGEFAKKLVLDGNLYKKLTQERSFNIQDICWN